jgi:Dyp-type peroxidase family
MEIQLQKEDIQGLLLRSYSELDSACYVMIKFNQIEKAKQWLAGIINKITTANTPKPFLFALQIAFTNHGIEKLRDKNDVILTHFSREFEEGITSEVRKRILGDLDTNDSSLWDWGNEKHDREIDAVLMLYAKDCDELNKQYDDLKAVFEAHNIQEIIKLDTSNMPIPEHKEHFGFTDGISQPKIKGFSNTEVNASNEFGDFNMSMPGEFILGYENEYNIMPFSPIYQHGTVGKEIGKNGSYMVFRHLEQDVKGFWGFIKNEVQTNPHFNVEDDILLASKMFGRFPNGNPLTLTDNSNKSLTDKNDFFYAENDKDGFKCPVGSHIRKSNPRDGIDNDRDASKNIAKKHRILRRGRSYGEPLDESMNPDKMLASTVAGERGLYFICFNANIARQFEFIQQAWLNNSKFDGLDNDVDPINGFAYDNLQYTPGNFTVQGCPVRKKVKNIPQFVTVKGSAYFFMPGIEALRFMASV